MGGVGLLVGVAVAWDVYACTTGAQTISAAVRQLRRTPWGRMAVGGAVAALLIHLTEEDA